MPAKREKIVYIQKLGEVEDYVYDLEVEGSHTFLANDIYVHNTDSVFMCGFKGTPEEILKESEVLRDKLNKSYDEFIAQFGVKKHRLSIKAEELFDIVTFIGKKKRYFGRMIFKRGDKVDLLEIIGFETRRSDSSLFTKKIQKEVMDMVNHRFSEDKIRAYLVEKIKVFKTLPLKDVSIPKAIVMDINKYTVDTNVIKAAKYANKYLGKAYDSGDKPRFVYVKKVPPNLPSTFGVNPQGKPRKVEGICFDEEEDIKGFEIDYDRMILLQICRKVNSILRALNYREVRADAYQRDLSSF